MLCDAYQKEKKMTLYDVTMFFQQIEMDTHSHTYNREPLVFMFTHTHTHTHSSYMCVREC